MFKFSLNFTDSYLGNIPTAAHRPINFRQYRGPRVNFIRQPQTMQQQQQQQQPRLLLQQLQKPRVDPLPLQMNQSGVPYLNGMRPQLPTQRYQSPGIRQPPPYRPRPPVAAPAPSNPAMNINFYNSSNQNEANGESVQTASNQNNRPYNWVYNAPSIYATSASQPPTSQNNGNGLTSISVNNAQTSNQALLVISTTPLSSTSVAPPVNHFRIKSVNEINKNVLSSQQQPKNGLNHSPTMSFNVLPPPTQVPPKQLLQTYQSNNDSNTPPSPPDTPSLEDKFDVNIIQYGEQIQIFTCPKYGYKDDLTDILQHRDDSRELVRQCILNAEFVESAKNAIEQERRFGRRTDQIRNQIREFFQYNVPGEYQFLVDDV